MNTFKKLPDEPGQTPQRPKREDDPYQARILDAARQLFDEHGLKDVSMYQIAKTAGIGQGSLYRRYADKGEICYELLKSYSERLLTGLEEDARSVEGNFKAEGVSAMDTLLSSIKRIVDFVDEHAELLMVIKSEFNGKRQPTQFGHPLFVRLNSIITEMLRQALDAGEICDIDPQFMGSALIAIISPDSYLYQQKYQETSKEEILKGIVRILRAMEPSK